MRSFAGIKARSLRAITLATATCGSLIYQSSAVLLGFAIRRPCSVFLEAQLEIVALSWVEQNNLIRSH